MPPQPSFTDREIQRRAAAAANGVSRRVKYIIDMEEGGKVSQAARRLGVSQRGLQKVYRGITRDPHASLLVRVAELYQVDLHWLLTGVERGHDEHVQRQAARVATQMLHHLVATVGSGLLSDRPATQPRPRSGPGRRDDILSPYAPDGLADMPGLR